MEAFARRAIALSIEDRSKAPKSGWVFFDRSLVDAASALRHICGDDFIEKLAHDHRYNRCVFLTPPWPEIYQMDGERQHGFTAAVEEYDRLLRDYAELSYETRILPKSTPSERAAFLLQTLEGKP